MVIAIVKVITIIVIIATINNTKNDYHRDAYPHLNSYPQTTHPYKPIPIQYEPIPAGSARKASETPIRQ